jgi:transaldolase
MNATRNLHDLGQSLWLDNITRGLLDSGTLARHIRDFSVTGITSNPTIFAHAIGDGDRYDTAIRRTMAQGEGVDDAVLAPRLQREGADAFSESCHQLPQRIGARTKEASQAGAP